MNCSNMVPPHRLQLFKNCCSMGPFHGVQLIWRRLLQSASSRAAVPAKNLLLCGLSTGCSFLQGTSTCCSVKSSTDYSVDILSGVVLRVLQRDNLLHHGLLHGPHGNLLQCLEHLLLSSPLTLVSAEVFLSHFSCSFSQLLHGIFYLFFNMFSQRHHQFCCLAQQCPIVALFQS